MVVQSFSLRLKRCLQAGRTRCALRRRSPLAQARRHRRDAARVQLRAAWRALDCALLAAMASAVALGALLCASASRVGFAQVSRVAGWLP
ncbi:hypothetical protein WJ03_24760 [Burkholderia vietnamiensis]|nr:hypothetical protein [Burkholderia vietnamiensis]AOJ16213.1 hypothetical protein WJ02_21915 [Burkholderia vietnamiensis]KVE93406.1 hypothetical protein WJ03_24760 [Burkholderia vietnamiensis]